MEVNATFKVDLLTFMTGTGYFTEDEIKILKTRNFSVTFLLLLSISRYISN